MTEPDLDALIHRSGITVTPRIDFPVDIGERWPVLRSGERQPINRTLRRLINQRDGERCLLCSKPGRLFELDHIVPWSAGGPDTSDNLRIVCHPCNHERSNYRTDRDVLAIPVTLACDPCITNWIRCHGVTRYGRCVPGAKPHTAWCGNCRAISHVTDPGRLK